MQLLHVKCNSVELTLLTRLKRRTHRTNEIAVGALKYSCEYLGLAIHIVNVRGQLGVKNSVVFSSRLPVDTS